MLKRFFTLFIIALLILPTIGESQELGLHFMPNVYQANKTNPAYMTEQRTVYTFPSVFLNFHHTGASYNDLIRTGANGQNILDLDPVIANLDEQNIVRFGMDLETSSVSFGGKIWRGSISHAMRMKGFFSYPKDLVEFGWNGNSSFVGESANIAPDFQAMAYSELGLGFAMKLPKITVGGRLKILSGLVDISSENTLANVRTDAEYYQLHLSTYYSINSSTLAGQNDLDNFEPALAMKIFSRNFGLAIDLGATMEVTEKLTVAASLLDLGGISWNANATNFTSKGEYTYEGLDVANILRDDEVDVEESTDTLQAIFDFKESNNSYYTALPSKMYLSGRYKVNAFFTAGALFYMERFRTRTLPGLAINGTANLGKIFSAGLTYSVYGNTYNNLGLNTQLKLGPVQVFFLTDNLIAAVKPFDSRNVNLRFGMNLAFK